MHSVLHYMVIFNKKSSTAYFRKQLGANFLRQTECEEIELTTKKKKNKIKI